MIFSTIIFLHQFVIINGNGFVTILFKVSFGNLCIDFLVLPYWIVVDPVVQKLDHFYIYF